MPTQRTYFVSIAGAPAPARLVVTEDAATFEWALTSPKVSAVGRAMRDHRAVADALSRLMDAYDTGEVAVTPEGSPTVAELLRRAELAVDPAHVARVADLAAKAIELSRTPHALWERALEYAKHLGNLLPSKAEDTRVRHLVPAEALAETVCALAVTVQAELRTQAATAAAVAARR